SGGPQLVEDVRQVRFGAAGGDDAQRPARPEGLAIEVERRGRPEGMAAAAEERGGPGAADGVVASRERALPGGVGEGRGGRAAVVVDGLALPAGGGADDIGGRDGAHASAPGVAAV